VISNNIGRTTYYGEDIIRSCDSSGNRITDIGSVDPANVVVYIVTTTERTIANNQYDDLNRLTGYTDVITSSADDVRITNVVTEMDYGSQGELAGYTEMSTQFVADRLNTWTKTVRRNMEYDPETFQLIYYEEEITAQASPDLV